jgi:hypothetical protein
MKKSDKLTLRWSKKDVDFVVSYPLGVGTASDAHFIQNVIDYKNKDLSFKSFVDELEFMGYDITTLKLSIEPKLPNNKKFKILTEKYGDV